MRDVRFGESEVSLQLLYLHILLISGGRFIFKEKNFLRTYECIITESREIEYTGT